MEKRARTHAHGQKAAVFIPKDDFIIYCVWKFSAAYRHQTVYALCYTWMDGCLYATICKCNDDQGKKTSEQDRWEWVEVRK